ncbi:unnamed protein product [Lymnaea stagnalis]|uniref:Antistasin-like domain-containing protein n=1 Tax=Lymnaea stagnalis TaxID=6523 RepID=A0AAV2HGK4_LYMST
MKSLCLLSVFGCFFLVNSALGQLIAFTDCPPLPPCARPPSGCHHTTDENGCMTCHIMCPRKACPPVCDNVCLNGHALDANGCETCACNPDVPFLECHTWMKCAQGVCPYACSCQPNC